MQRLEVSGAVRLIYRSLGVKGLTLVYLSFILVIFHPKCSVMKIRYKDQALRQQTIQTASKRSK